MSDETRAVLAEVHAERIRQDAKWGQQNHPTWFPGDLVDVTFHHRQAEMWKALNDQRVNTANAAGCSSDRNSAWDGVLLEEVFEALAESDPVARRAELVQVAAVAVAAIEHIDRQSAPSSPVEGKTTTEVTE